MVDRKMSSKSKNKKGTVAAQAVATNAESKKKKRKSKKSVEANEQSAQSDMGIREPASRTHQSTRAENGIARPGVLDAMQIHKSKAQSSVKQRQQPPSGVANSTQNAIKEDPSGDDQRNGNKPSADKVKENQGPWTAEEHDIFLKGFHKHGKQWQQIAEMVTTRSVKQVRTHGQKYIKKFRRTKEKEEEEGQLRNDKRMEIELSSSDDEDPPAKQKGDDNPPAEEGNSEIEKWLKAQPKGTGKQAEIEVLDSAEEDDLKVLDSSNRGGGKENSETLAEGTRSGKRSMKEKGTGNGKKRKVSWRQVKSVDKELGKGGHNGTECL